MEIQRLTRKIGTVAVEENAEIGYRPLSGMPFVIGIPGSQADIDNNIVGHQHIWFDDDGTNIGFTDNRLFSENQNMRTQYIFMQYYDDAILHQAVKNLGTPGNYSFWINDNNCQDYVDKIIIEYYKIKNGKK